MKTNGELRARICSLEIQLDRSKREIEQQREEFLSKGAKATNMLCDADARIAELEQKLVESRDYAISEAAKVRTEYERQQAVLVDSGEQLLLYNPKEETVGGVENSFKRTVGACKLQAILNFEQALTSVKPATTVCKYDCFSNDDGDRWLDTPDDIEFVDGLQIGDQFELLAGWHADRVTFRVTKVPSCDSDEYVVELVKPARQEGGTK